MNTPMCVGKMQSKVPPHCPNHGRQGMMGNGFQGGFEWLAYNHQNNRSEKHISLISEFFAYISTILRLFSFI